MGKGKARPEPPSLLRHRSRLRRRGAVSFPPAARVREDSRVANEYAQREEEYVLASEGRRVTRSCRPAATLEMDVKNGNLRGGNMSRWSAAVTK